MRIDQQHDGVGVAGVQATSGVIVNVSAGPGDDVRLRGLNIEGLHSALEGIGFASGASLTIEDSSINGVTNAGVQFEPIAASALYVVNTKVTNCGTRGVFVAPITASRTVQVTLERLEAINDGAAGVFVDGSQSGATQPIIVSVADSLMSGAHAGVDGVSAVGHTPVEVVVRNSVITGNLNELVAEANATVVVSHSTISGNVAEFVENGVGAIAGTYGDNVIEGNVGVAFPPTPFHLQ